MHGMIEGIEEGESTLS